ncbi:MAG: hypothetical protein LBR43_02240 [Spiroplasmataceae bacterium]|nr:hypothetical protein [Spiroplasmataceae bacterium]
MKSYYNELLKLEEYPRVNNLSAEQKNFIFSKFSYFREYTDYELREFSHDDPSWKLARENYKKENYKVEPIMSRGAHILNYWKEFYQYVLEEIEEK